MRGQALDFGGKLLFQMPIFGDEQPPAVQHNGAAGIAAHQRRGLGERVGFRLADVDKRVAMRQRSKQALHKRCNSFGGGRRDVREQAVHGLGDGDGIGVGGVGGVGDVHNHEIR